MVADDGKRRAKLGQSPSADDRLDLVVESLRDRSGVGDQRPTLIGVADDLGAAVMGVGHALISRPRNTSGERITLLGTIGPMCT